MKIMMILNVFSVQHQHEHQHGQTSCCLHNNGHQEAAERDIIESTQSSAENFSFRLRDAKLVFAFVCVDCLPS